MTTNKHGYPEPIIRETNEFICVAYLRIPDLNKYNGEYGFDWLELELDSGRIEKIQGLDYSLITHYFLEDNELGDYKPVGEDTEINIQNHIKEHYPAIVSVGNKYIDAAHILTKKGQEIDLELQVKCLQGELNSSELIEIRSNEHYIFKYKKKEKPAAPAPADEKPPKTGKRKKKDRKIEEIGLWDEQPVAETAADVEANPDYQEILLIPLEQKEVEFILTIKCLDYTTDENGEHFPVYLKREGNADIPIGGFTMMQNVPLKLNFRVIALVDDENPETKAKELFRIFKENNVYEYLNTNSLNQAGYEVEIENQAMLNNPDIANVDDYLFAFNKDAWVEEGMFEKDYTKNKKSTTIIIRDGIEQRFESEEKVTMDVFKHNDNQIDYKVMKAYRAKLENANLPTNYERLIILANYESDSSTGGFSRTDPIDHYAVLLYKTNTASKTTYAHEIGHMLGLQHTFMESKEENAFSGKKAYYATFKNEIQNRENNDNIYTRYKTSCRCRKDTLVSGLMNYNTFANTKLSELRKKRRQAAASNGDLLIEGKKVNKAAFLAHIDNQTNEFAKKIDSNTVVLDEVNNRFFKDYQEFKASQTYYILKEDDLKIRNEHLLFEEKTLKQYIKNYLIYPKESTQNMMDYSDNKIKFSNYQIRIMREDHENY